MCWESRCSRAGWGWIGDWFVCPKPAPGRWGKAPKAWSLGTGDWHLGTPCPARRRRFRQEPGLAERNPGKLGGWSPNPGGVAAAGSLRTASGVRKPFHAIPPGRRVRANPGLPASTPPAYGAATSSLPSQALPRGDEDVATPFLFSNGGSVGPRLLTSAATSYFPDFFFLSLAVGSGPVDNGWTGTSGFTGSVSIRESSSLLGIYLGLRVVFARSSAVRPASAPGAGITTGVRKIISSVFWFCLVFRLKAFPR